ncbi:c-type cytochrome [Dyella flagellata]|uniref:Cytochrome c n=1 Tax=Dyella flagellata TaxID=1867833 RepID=A0ABQ5XI28_9GAMM|nr:c-type cytochrome [Dyella flagellata]GLQ90124.1 cytochrome c [Dyella flagellata]
MPFALLLGGALAHADQASVPDTLQQRIAACTSCHGLHGEGSSGSGFSPRLAGKPAGYLALQLQNFQRGLRQYAPMEYIARSLTPDYMHEIAEYFAAQQVPYERRPVPALAPSMLQRGEQLVTSGDPARQIPPCQACHGKQLTGTEPSVPGLAGLPYDYISAQLGSWRAGTRASAAPDCMAQIAGRLAPADITAVSAWLAGRQVPADTHPQPAGSITPPLRCGVLQAHGDGA